MRPFIYTTKIWLVCCLTLLVFSNCRVSQKSAPQGITGIVLEVIGNQMPPAAENNGTAVQRTIRVYAPTKISEATGRPPLFSEVRTTLIAEAKSNKKGHFDIQLPPGKYSIFVITEDQYYANSFNSDNFINLITVKPNEWTAVQLVINNSASF